MKKDNGYEYKFKEKDEYYLLNIKSEELSVCLSLTKLKKDSTFLYENIYTIEELKNLGSAFSIIDSPINFVEAFRNLYRKKKISLSKDKNDSSLIQIICKVPILYKEEVISLNLKKNSNIENNLNTLKTNLKLLIVGEKEVGKTSYINCLANKPFNEEYVPTKVSQSVIIEIKRNEKKYSFFLYDLSGEKTNKTIIELFAKDADGCIIMTDIFSKTNKKE